MITVTFQAPTLQEVHVQMSKALMAFDSKTSATMPPRALKIQDEPERITESTQIEMDLPNTVDVKYEEPPKKRGRKKKEAIEERGATDAKEKESYSKEEVYEALQKVNVNVSLVAAREILLSFGVQRMSELKTDQYPAFVKRCEEVLA
jgi:hypothetical protein